MSNQQDYAKLLKDAYHELRRLRLEVEKMKSAEREPLAIVGIGCRFPAAPNPRAYWQMLCDGEHPVSEIPQDRWDMDSFYDPATETLGSIRVKLACLLDDVAGFDAQFFGISPREAKTLDPQQRLMMEVTWEALEDAGYNPHQLSGSNTGVYFGVASSDYLTLIADGRDTIDAYYGTGNSRSIAAHRLSYFLNLTGPSMVIDTACSSSLVALDLAASALRRGETDMALVGGVNLILSPEISITFSQAQMLAPDGKSKTFDAAANGYVRGEGAGTIVIKRLSDALAAGDHIYSVIRGVAINQDGRSNGLTAPNGSAQVRVIRQALAQAGLEPADVDYVEAHGTGTALGDPIEMIAIGNAYGQGHDDDHPIYVGSVKTNIGHLEAAAGMAGLIKATLALHHRQLPPHLHFETPNPHIPWDRLPVAIPVENVPLGQKATYRAGISSFGFGGANAHVIVESYTPAAPETQSVSQPYYVAKLAARRSQSLQRAAAQLAQRLDDSTASLADIAHTLNTGRADFGARTALVADSVENLREQLASLKASDIAQLTGAENTDVVFMFTGQGSQSPNMMRELYQHQPVFQAHLDHVIALLNAHLDVDLFDVIFSRDDDARVHQTRYTQPALFAVEYALAQLWMSWGVMPAAVTGHSVGEVVAAVIAGVFSLDEGARLIAARGRLMWSLPQEGAMAAIFAGVEAVEPLVKPHRAVLSIAAVNSPAETVISGEEAALKAVMAQLAAQGIRCRELTVSHAFHSPLMQPILDDFRAVAASIAYHEPQLPLIANVTGALVEAGQVTNADYWTNHIRGAVRFADGVSALHEAGYRVFLEVGPRPILTGLGRRTLTDAGVTWATSLRPPRHDMQQLLDAIGTLYRAGVALDWAHLGTGRKVPLPTYAFERQRYWWTDDTTPLRRKKPLQFSEPTQAEPRVTNRAAAVATEPENTRPQRPAEGLAAELMGLQPAPRRERLLAFLRAEVGRVLGLPAAQITEQQGFFDMGLDSLMSVELKNRLEQGLGVSLSLTLAFDYPSVDKLTDYLLEDVLELSEASHTAQDTRPSRHLDEPIAVVGMAVRLPGGANTVDAYWELLHNGVDAITSVPQTRWHNAKYYDDDPNAPGKLYTRGGGFLSHVDVSAFDPLFFGISPREADAMDPQHRLLLEVSWEALEYANIPAASLQGTRTGVFVGINTADYLHLINANGIETIDVTMATGNTFSAAAGRVSYIFGFQGPSLAIDTACSSSLVSIHMASQSLRSGESDVALAGGVNLMLSPVTTIGMAKLRALAPDGHCKTFDAAADGYGRGEGVGMVVLKRLSDALADGDHVLAVVRGSAVNQDGASGGLTVPNGPAQQAVIRDALRMAGLMPHEVDYVEAHGTGTALGDPIELNALNQALAKGRNPDHPLYVGSVKTNIGHLEAAAGIAGFVKLVLALQHREIPPHINLKNPTPHIDWDSMPIRVPLEPTAWEKHNDKPRIAGVSSFGFSGTNAHVIVQEAPPVEPRPVAQDGKAHVLALSARSETALRDLVGRYAAFVAQHPELSVADMAYAASTGRNHFDYRTTFIASDAADLLCQLQDDFEITQIPRVPPKDIAESFDAAAPADADWLTMLDAAYRAGVMIDWERIYDETPHHPVVLPTYPFQRRRHWIETPADDPSPESIWRSTEDWFYEVAWIETAPLDAPKGKAGHWLVFVAGSAHDDALLAALGERATTLTRIVPGDAYAFENGQITIRGGAYDDIERALAQANGLSAVRGVLFAWNLATYADPIHEDTLLEYEATVATTFMYLATAMAKAGSSAQLWGVSAGAEPLVPHSITQSGLRDAMLWGLGRVVTLEMPEIWGGMIDLDAADMDFGALVSEIVQRQDEDQIGYRNGTRYVARLVPRPQEPQQQSLALDPQGTYLITGGLGKLGLLVARWMAERGAGHIVLTSRSGLPPRETWDRATDASQRARLEAVQALEALGTTIEPYAVDVTDRAGMSELLARLADANLRGIVHAAGVLESNYLVDTDQDSLLRVLKPKVQGTWLLHELTQSFELDFFLQFSSAAATWGSAMAGHYVAANHFQDIFAHYRRDRNHMAQAINWGWWAEGGMVSEEEQAYFEAIGLKIMPGGPALMALEHLLATGSVQTTVSPVDWSKYKPVFEAKRRRPFLELMDMANDAAATDTRDEAFLQRFAMAAATERHRLMIAYLQGVVGELLRLDPTTPIDPQTGFFDVGMDSLSSVELKVTLENALGVALPSTIAFEYNSVNDLSAYLVDALSATDTPTGRPPAADPAAADDALEGLSDEDLLALLEDELND